jgi:hypothetical protein
MQRNRTLSLLCFIAICIIIITAGYGTISMYGIFSDEFIEKNTGITSNINGLYAILLKDELKKCE